MPSGLSQEGMVMDPKRFDAIAQDLAAATSRRGMVKGAGLAAGGAALASLLGLVGREEVDAAGRKRRKRRWTAVPQAGTDLQRLSQESVVLQVGPAVRQCPGTGFG